MTLRCNWRLKQRSHQQRLALIFLLGLSALSAIAVGAEDGTQIPPAPVLRHHRDNSPDPEFRSPMKGDNFQQRQAGGGDFAAQRRQRFRKRMEQQFAGGPGDNPGNHGRNEFGGRENMMEGGPNLTGAGGFPAGPGGPDGRFHGGAGGGARGHMSMGTPFGIAGGGRKQLDLTPLNLTEQQKQQIKQVRQSSREHAREMKQKLTERQMALRAMIFSPDATEVQIKAARKQLREAQNQMDEISWDDLLNIRRVLTAEQRQKLPDLAPAMPSQNQFGPRGGTTIGERRPPQE